MARIEGYGDILTQLGDIRPETITALQRNRQLDMESQRETALDEYRKSLISESSMRNRIAEQQEQRRAAQAQREAVQGKHIPGGGFLQLPDGRLIPLPERQREMTPSERLAQTKYERDLMTEQLDEQTKRQASKILADKTLSPEEQRARFYELTGQFPSGVTSTRTPPIVQGGPGQPAQVLVPDPTSPIGWKLATPPGAQVKPGSADITPAERSSILRSNSSATAQSQSLLRTLSGLAPDMDRLEESVDKASFGGKLFPGYLARGAEALGSESGRAVIKAQAAANQIISTFDRAVLDLKGQRAYKFVERGEATVFSPSLTVAENKRQLASYYHTIATRSRAIVEDMVSRADDAESVGASQQVAPLRRQATEWDAFSKHMFERMNRVVPTAGGSSVIFPKASDPLGIRGK